MSDACTSTLLPTKTSLDGDSMFRYVFGAEVSLPLTQSVLEITHDTT